MAKYYLNARDRALVAEAIGRVHGGAGRNSPNARRRRQVVLDAAGGTRLVPAIVFRTVPAATLKASELRVVCGITESPAAYLLEQAELEDGKADWTVREEADPEVEVPPGGTPQMVRVQRRVLNWQAARITASLTKPKLVHGLVQTLDLGGVSTQFFVAVSWTRNSIIHGITSAAVSGIDFTATTNNVISGADPRAATTESITFKNPFAFNLPANGDFRAEEDDNGQWQVTQADCPV